MDRLESYTSTLPTLVVHGWWISKIVLVAVTGMLVLVAFGLHRLARPRDLFSRRWLALAIVGCGVIAFVGLRAIGRHLIDGTIESRPPSAELTDRAWKARVVVATALPGARADALTEIDRSAALLPRTERGARQRVAIAMMNRGCSGAVYALIDQLAIVAAIDVGKDCVGTRVEALVFAGRYADAIPLLTEDTHGDLRLLALVAGRRWTEAANVVDALNRSDVQCIGDLMRSLAGDKEAVARIDAGRGLGCEIARAVTSNRDEWSRELLANALRAVPATGSTVTDSRWAAIAQIAWSFGGSPTQNATAATRTLLRSAPHDAVEPWLATFALAAQDVAESRAWWAVWNVYAGSFEVARQYAADARALDLAIQIRRGDLQLELLAGDVIPPEVVDEVALRSGRSSVAFADRLTSDCGDPHGALMRAGEGDGDALAEVLEQCPFVGIPAPALVAVAPRIRRDRERFVGAAARMIAEDQYSLEIPFALVPKLSLVRDIARAGGNDAEALRLQRVIDRHLTAFAGREQLVALILWRLVTREPMTRLD